MASRTEHDIVALENRYWKAIRDGDADTAISLTADDCILVGAEGVVRLDRQAVTKLMKEPLYRVREFQLRDMAVSMLGDDVAVVAYRVNEKIEVNGEPIELAVADSSTWLKRHGQWRCSMHTASLLGDPYGRDRG